MCVCVCVYDTHMYHSGVWRSEITLRESIFFLYDLGARDATQVSRFGGLEGWAILPALDLVFWEC